MDNKFIRYCSCANTLVTNFLCDGSSSVPDLPEEETQALLSLFSEDITDWLFSACPVEGENQEMTEKGGKERACEESVRVLDDKELEDFVEMQKNINTKRKQHQT